MPNAYLSVPTSTPFEQAEQQIAQLKIDTKEKFFYTDRKRRNVNAELMAISNHSQMADSLRAINNACIWNVMHAKTRIHAISVLCQSSIQGDWMGMGNNYESLVLSLLGFTNDYSQQDSLLNKLRENNNDLLKSLWSKLDMQSLDEFVNTITGWIVSKATDRPSFSELHNQSFVYSSSSSNSAPLTYLEFYKYAGTNNLSHNYIFTSSSAFGSGTGVTIETFFDPDKGNPPGGSFATVNADAFTGWVAVRIMNDIPALGLRENQNLVVPGIWVQWLAHRLETEDISEAVNLIEQVVLMLATDGLTNALFDGAFIAINSTAVLEARVIGQDLQAVVVSENVETPIVLKLEPDANGVFTYNRLKWEQGYQADAQLVGRMPNPKFKAQSGEIVQRELLVVRTSAGICVRDATAVVGNNIFYSTSDALALTYDAGNAVNQTLRTQIFQLYNQRKWGALEALFNQNGLNGGYPPAWGGYNTKIVSLKKGMKFDRYQENFNPNNLIDGQPILTGEFTSPIYNAQPYTYSERALRIQENQNALYYEIEILEDLPFTGEESEVMPWFNFAGNGKQTKWNLPKDGIYPKSWTKLAIEGKIRITIKSSPNNQFSNLAGKVIE